MKGMPRVAGSAFVRGAFHAADIRDKAGVWQAGFQRHAYQGGHRANRHGEHHKIGAVKCGGEIVGCRVDAEIAGCLDGVLPARPKPHGWRVLAAPKGESERTAEQSAAEHGDG